LRANVNVLVVDDSAVVRQVMIAVLTRAPGFTVDTASDPIIAIAKLKRKMPDVIVLDLEMPRMDGLTFLRKLMADRPIPVVVCSSLAAENSDLWLQALDEGAVAVVAKPQLGVRDFLVDSAQMFVDTLRGAAKSRVRPRRQPAPAERLMHPPDVASIGLRVTTDKVVAIGASTGGTEAIRHILERMPPNAPGIVIVQHMPEGFTRAFAQRLNTLCAIEVKEAEDGDRITAGRALIAPGNRHMRVVRSGAKYIVRVEDGPLVSRHRPSVDFLFQSVAKSAGINAIGALLTGMGDDGADGLLEMHKSGAYTVAQDEASCVVFGMPKEAIARGGVERIAPIANIPQIILTAALSKGR
jgi:two-component system chemotaxis response regulator CheB